MLVGIYAWFDSSCWGFLHLVHTKRDNSSPPGLTKKIA